MKCKNCNVDLKKEGLRFVESGVVVSYNVFLDGKGYINYKQDDFDSCGGDSVFICPNCGEDVCYSEEKAIKILKGR
jgi:hypothetical protein